MDSSGKALLPIDSRTAVAQDPPSSGRLPVARDAGEAGERAEPGRGISARELRALLGQPETQRFLRAAVAARLARGPDSPVLDDLVQEANLEMLASRHGPRSIASARGWISTIARRAVSAHFRRGASARKWMVPDEVDLDEVPATDAVPDAPLLLGDWLARAVASDAKDAETLEMLLYKARLDATYEQVAADHGLTANALRCRVNAFKTKYEAEWRRSRMLLVLLLVSAAVAVAVAGWLWLRSARAAEQPAPVPEAPAVHPSATASAEDTPFEPATPPPTLTQPPRPSPAPRRPETPPQRYNQFGKPVH